RPRADGRLSRVRAPACTRGRSARHRAQCPRWLAGVRHRGAWAGRGTRHRAAARWTFARAGRSGRRRVRARGWWSAANNGDGVTVRFAERMSRLGTESAFEVLAHARRLEAEGRQVIHLEIGEPDFATPQNIVDAAVRAINNGATHYTPASGILEVRD